MGKKIGRSPRHRGRTRAKAAKRASMRRSSRVESAAARPNHFATKRFVNDLMVRGEAANLTKEGKLPLHATHVIKGQNQDGTVKVERVRFRTF